MWDKSNIIKANHVSIILSYLSLEDKLKFLTSSKYIYQMAESNRNFIHKPIIHELTHLSDEVLQEKVEQLEERDVLSVKDLIMYLLTLDENMPIGMEKMVVVDEQSIRAYGYFITSDFQIKRVTKGNAIYYEEKEEQEGEKIDILEIKSIITHDPLE